MKLDESCPRLKFELRSGHIGEAGFSKVQCSTVCIDEVPSFLFFGGGCGGGPETRPPWTLVQAPEPKKKSGNRESERRAPKEMLRRRRPERQEMVQNRGPPVPPQYNNNENQIAAAAAPRKGHPDNHYSLSLSPSLPGKHGGEDIGWIGTSTQGIIGHLSVTLSL